MNNDIPKAAIRSAVFFILGMFTIIFSAILSLHAYNNVRKYNDYKAMGKLLENSRHLIEINRLSDSLDVTNKDKVLELSRNLFYLEEEMGNYYHECAIYYFLNDKIYKINPYVHGDHFLAMQPISSLPENIQNTIQLIKNNNSEERVVFETLNDTEDLKYLHKIKNGYLYIKKDRN